MSGFTVITGQESIMYTDNASFDGTKRGGKMTADGQIWIGSAIAPHVRLGALGSSDSSITWTVGNGTLTGQVAGGSTVGKTISGNTGGAISPVAGNWNIISTGSLQTAGSGNTLTTSLVGLTNHAVLVGAGTDTIAKVGPTATAGQYLQSAGAAAHPAFSTATLPSTATGTGTILRADGTNWVATTATFPNTVTVSNILYGSASNVVSGLATANSATLVTNSTGVPVMSSTMTNGQIIIGSTGATPTAGTITSTGATITITNGAGTINLDIPATTQTFGVENIGIAYSGGTFTVHGYDGTALSASNIGKAWVQSKATPGRLVQLSATENFTFTDGSSGTTDNQRFGLTTAVDWANDIPFFLYIIAHDTPASAPAFGISRNPAATNAPASASIGVSGAVVNVGQGDFFLLTGASSGTPTVGNYDTNPCVCLGSFRMRFTGATDHWTVQALATTDGIDEFNEETVFIMPAGVNGSAAGTYIQSNAGTEPVFTTNNMKYCIFRTGLVWMRWQGENASTAGIGVNVLNATLPYASIASTDDAPITGYCFYQSSTSLRFPTTCAIAAGNSYVQEFRTNASATNFSNASIALTEALKFSVIYRAYGANAA